MKGIGVWLGMKAGLRDPTQGEINFVKPVAAFVTEEKTTVRPSDDTGIDRRGSISSAVRRRSAMSKRRLAGRSAFRTHWTDKRSGIGVLEGNCALLVNEV